MQYYSTYAQGFSALCKEILLKEDTKVQIHEVGESYISYTSNLPIEKIKSFIFFEQTFLLIKYFTKDNKDFSNQTEWFYKNSSSVNFKLSKLGQNRTFRIVGSSNSLDNSRIQSEINRLDHVVNINRGGADYDIRIVEKNDHGFIGIRITHPAEFAGYLQKGSLRKEIAYYMLYLSEMKKLDIFIDPFCGGGIIPILRAKTRAYNKVFCTDKEIFSVKQKIANCYTPMKNLKVVQSDITNLYQNLKKYSQAKFNKIVTDPPWGLINKIDNKEDFYRNMFSVFNDITDNKATIVLLTPDLKIVEKLISISNTNFEISKVIKGKISGRESNIIKLIKE